ncbi:MAG: hypothetical protein R3F60_21085 [bacterium]
MAAELRLELEQYRVPSLRTGLDVGVYLTKSRVIHLSAFVPTRKAVRTVLGVLGRARQRFPDIDLYGFHFLPTSACLLFGAPSGTHKAAFLAWTLREISRRINKLLGLSGPLLARNECQQVVSAAHALAQLKEVMGQATEALLVRHPEEDPCASSTPALLRGAKLVGAFQYGFGPEVEVEVALDRLPGCEALSPAAYRVLLRGMADEVARAHRPRRKKAGIRLRDPESLRQLDPLSPSAPAKRQPRPKVHGTPAQQEEWRRAHDAARAAYTQATKAHWRRLEDPSAPMVPWPAGTVPPCFAPPTWGRAAAG